MDNAQKALAAKQAAQQSRDEQARAQGAADQLKKRIKEEFGCKSLKEAEALIEELTKAHAAPAKRCDEAWVAFQEVKT